MKNMFKLWEIEKEMFVEGRRTKKPNQKPKTESN